MKPVAIALILLLHAFASAQRAAPQRTLQSLVREHQTAIAKASQSDDPKDYDKAFESFITALNGESEVGSYFGKYILDFRSVYGANLESGPEVGITEQASRQAYLRAKRSLLSILAPSLAATDKGGVYAPAPVS